MTNALRDNHGRALWFPIAFAGRGTVLRDEVVFREGAGLMYGALDVTVRAGRSLDVRQVYVGEHGAWLLTALGWVSAEWVALERCPLWG